MMLYGTADNMFTLSLIGPGHTFYGQIGSLGTARGKDDFTCLGANQFTYLITCLIQSLPGPAAPPVYTGRIAIFTAKKGQHCLHNFLPYWSSCSMIHINLIHLYSATSSL